MTTEPAQSSVKLVEPQTGQTCVFEVTTLWHCRQATCIGIRYLRPCDAVRRSAIKQRLRILAVDTAGSTRVVSDIC